MDRRRFLARTGLLGAGIALARAGLLTAGAAAREPDEVLGPAVDGTRQVSHALARDTFSGLVAFVVPGQDRWSRAQGVTDPAPGGVEADAPAFLLGAVDSFYPLHDGVVRSLVAALVTGLEESDAPVPDELLDAGSSVAAELEEAVEQWLDNDQAVPLSALLAMLLNQLAVMVDPTSPVGEFPSPFANLSFDGKADAFQLLEEPAAELVAMVDSQLPEPMTDTVSGLLQFVAGALIEFAGFGVYTEYSAFDPDGRELTGAPVGWQLSGYLEETGFRPVEGWDELLGYYQGRREVSG